MSNLDTLCKASWEYEDPNTKEIFDGICPLRDTCLRYKARLSIMMVPFFDVVPVRKQVEQNRLNSNAVITCQFYLKWS